MTAESDNKALNLFLAAVPIGKIKEQLAYRSTASAMAAITRALKAAQKGKSPETARDIEIERLDSIYRQLYPSALQGDAKAVDQCLRISEQRLRLVDAPAKNQGLLKAYEETVKALHVREEDKAVLQTGRMIASQIDFAVAHGTGSEVTKALYLVPHLMNVLGQLGATPAARGLVVEAVGSEAGRRQTNSGKVTALEDYMKKFG
jgi:hypothetical protein